MPRSWCLLCPDLVLPRSDNVNPLYAGPNTLDVINYETTMSAPQEQPESSDEEYEDDAAIHNEMHWQSPAQGDDQALPSSPTSGATSSSQQQKLSHPIQKRRRVTRACDECRRKKIKCDGKQPCTHCTVYSYGS